MRPAPATLLLMRATLWLAAQPAVPTAAEISRRWAVHENTALAWRREFLTARAQIEPTDRSAMK